MSLTSSLQSSGFVGTRFGVAPSGITGGPMGARPVVVVTGAGLSGAAGGCGVDPDEHAANRRPR